MTIQTDNFSARQRTISVVPDSHKEATNSCNLKLQIPKLTLTQKLNAFDPAVHGGELMVDDSVGVEFGARAWVLSNRDV
jgi:hypothetical protein